MDKREYLAFVPTLAEYHKLLIQLKDIVRDRAVAEYSVESGYNNQLRSSEWHATADYSNGGYFYFTVERYGYNGADDYSLSIEEAFDKRDEYIEETRRILKSVDEIAAAKKQKHLDAKAEQEIAALKEMLKKYPQYGK